MPSVQPYVDRARLAVVPLLHGAGVKRKVIQSMMGGTPVVTTPVGAEGLDLVQGEHALIAADAADLAAGITRLLTDDDLWHRLADGRRGPRRRSATASTWSSDASREVVEAVMEQPPRRRATGRRRRRVRTAPARPSGPPCNDDCTRIGRPGSVLLVATTLRGAT